MRSAHSPIERLRFLIRTVATLVSACLLAGLLVSPASATHFRYGTISWTQVSDTTVEATVQLAWRRAGFISCVDPTHPDVLTNPFGTAAIPCTGAGGFVGLGDVTAPFTAPLQWGDGSAGTTLYLLVTSVDLANNWFFGEALDPSSLPGPPTDTTLPHTYTTPGDYTAFFESCCRLSPPILINNADGGFSVETVINIVAGGGTNDSPVSGLPPIVLCPVNSLCNFFVPAADPDGDTLSFRMSLSDEAKGLFGGVLGSADEFVQPGFAGPDNPGAGNPASIDVNTGLYTWNTTGAGSSGDLFSTQVTIEDGSPPGMLGTSKTAVDFLIELAPADPNPPTITSTPDDVCGSENAQTVAVGSSLIFTITGSDADGDALTLNVTGLPAGASMTPSLPLSQPPSMNVSSQFSWNPLIGDLGTSIVNFFVSNPVGGFTTCSVTINVIANFIPVANDDPTPGDPDILANSGQTINIDVLANDTNLNDGVTALTPVSGSGATLVVVGTAPNLSIDYTSAPGYGGPDTFTYTIMDTDGDVSNSAIVTIQVDGSVAETPEGDDIVIFGGPDSGVALAAAGAVAVNPGESMVTCCTVADPRSGAGNVDKEDDIFAHDWVEFDIGAALAADEDCAALPDPGAGNLIISRHFVPYNLRAPDGTDDVRFGICAVVTEVDWQGPIFLDVSAGTIFGIEDEVSCEPAPVSDQPLTLALSVDKPGYTAPMMRTITSDCDPRSVDRWSTWYFTPNAKHLTEKESSLTYTSRMSSVFKNMLGDMRDAGAITGAFHRDLTSLIRDAERLFKRRRATEADYQDAVLLLDEVTRLTLLIDPLDLDNPRPPTNSPYVSGSIFFNPQGDAVSHAGALRYAVCSEFAFPGALSSCEMEEDIVSALPPVPAPPS